MRVILLKKQTGKEFIKEMVKTYGSIIELEKRLKRTNNMIYYVDLEAWKYHLNHLDEIINRSKTIITDKLKINETDLELLIMIKTEQPESIRELARLINKDISTVQPKVKKLAENGLIELKQGNKNRLVPYLNYDEITVSI
ncbi:MAG: MarR family transcriptional regulator [Methanobrevibacter sp.]|jgi:DNA-binding MarR family transcriptional regulator|nr:MarR family transcriptional regulator [Methanobrevibacter sp.]